MLTQLRLRLPQTAAELLQTARRLDRRLPLRLHLLPPRPPLRQGRSPPVSLRLFSHPEGRSYQAFTALHKRGVSVLADYGKSSNLYFYYSDPSRNFQIRNVCPLEILAVELSLDGKYLAIACGSPTFKVLIVNVEERTVLGGSQNFIDLKDSYEAFLKLEFNPSNRKQLSLLFRNRVQVYELKDCVEITEGGVEKGLIVLPRHSMEAGKFEACLWDELGNVRRALFSCTWLRTTGSGCGRRRLGRSWPATTSRSRPPRTRWCAPCS